MNKETAMNDYLRRVEEDSILGMLILEPDEDDIRKDCSAFDISTLGIYLKKFPRLRRLNIPKKFVKFNGTHQRRDFEKMVADLEKRAPGAGLFLDGTARYVAFTDEAESTDPNE